MTLQQCISGVTNLVENHGYSMILPLAQYELSNLILSNVRLELIEEGLGPFRIINRLAQYLRYLRKVRAGEKCKLAKTV